LRRRLRRRSPPLEPGFFFSALKIDIPARVPVYF
jgi:hypothetical protein